MVVDLLYHLVSSGHVENGMLASEIGICTGISCAHLYTLVFSYILFHKEGVK